MVSVPTGAVVGCRWVFFTLKYRPDGSMDRYKAKLVAKNFIQTYDTDYFETLSLVAKMNSVRILFSLLLICLGYYSSWMLRMLSYMGIFRRKHI